MEIFNLFTTLAIATPSSKRQTHTVENTPLGTILEDDVNGRCMCVLHEGKPALVTTGGDVVDQWYDAKPVNADGSDVAAGKPNPDTDGTEQFHRAYLDYESRRGQLFQTDDGQVYLSTYGLGLYNADDDTVYAIGITDPSAKLTSDGPLMIRWLNADPVQVHPTSSASKEIRARSGC